LFFIQITPSVKKYVLPLDCSAKAFFSLIKQGFIPVQHIHFVISIENLIL